MPGGLDNGQREVLTAALADAAEYREARAGDAFCAGCQASDGLCPDHAADADLCDAYLHLARELGLAADR